MHPTCRRLLLLACATMAACADARSGDPLLPVETGAPVVLSPNGAVAATVGAAVRYDATKGGTVFSDPSRGGLAYVVTIDGASDGLAVSGSTITGTPPAPGVVEAIITAMDDQGRTISDRFAIVAFVPGLPTPVLPTVLELYADGSRPLPAHFAAAFGGASATSADNTPADNPITNAGATLGRVLFYDTRLSSNDGTSCSSCHLQSLGFGDALPRSVGFGGGLTGRHSPSLANARFYRPGRFFWDERAASLEAQVLIPIQDPVEMGVPLNLLVHKVAATPHYSPLFTQAFGSPDVTSDRIARALAQYVRSLVSGGSKFDRAFVGGTPNFAAVFTPQEQRGEQLFRAAGCNACHTSAALVSDGTHNIGLDASSTDVGAGGGAFKAPSLRNVGARDRFMHDGRFTSLAQVVDFYDSGVQANPGLDARLRAPDGTPKRLGLTATDKAALVAFLGTLTDSAFLTATRFSNPFAVPAPPAPPAAPGTAAVTIQGNSFRPGTLTVAPGTRINFTNLDNSRHSATFDVTQIASTPIFTSGTQTVTMPTAPGRYTYHCSVHGVSMSGTIIVP